jgi:hypothetical protein
MLMSRKFILLLFLLVVTCLKPNHAFAATYYLSPSGNDSANGSASGPWKTIKKANTTATSGDIIILKNGVYSGTDQAYQSLSKAGVSWQAENKHQAIIDGNFPPSSLNGTWNNIVTAWDSRCTTIGQWAPLLSVQASNISVDGLFMRNSCGRGMLIGDDVNNATIKNNRIDWTFVSGFYVTGETNNLQVIGNDLTRISFNDEYAHRVAGYCDKNDPSRRYCVNISIHMSGENMVVRDNLIAWGRGEIAMTGSRNLLFEKNIVVGNKNNFYNGWADGVIVRNNIFWAPDSQLHPGTHWEKSNKNDNDWHISSRNEKDTRWINYASGMNNIVYYNNLMINNSFAFTGYHNDYGSNTTNVYFGHNTLITGPETDDLFKLVFAAKAGATVDAKFTGIIESNLFDVRKDPGARFIIGTSGNDSVTFRYNTLPTNAPNSVRGPGDVYTNNPGLSNSNIAITFPIPSIGATSVDATAIRNAINTNNYRLNNVSSSINAAATLGAVGGIPIPALARSQDFLLLNRIQTPDVGAFEFTGSNPPTPPPTVNWDLTGNGTIDIFDFNLFVKKVMNKTESWSKVASFIDAFLVSAQ